MNNTIFNEIKKKALDDHIPIIMDDTLDYLDNILLNTNKDSILEIGTAVRILSYMLFKIFIRYRKNWYYWTRWGKSKRSNREH